MLRGMSLKPMGIKGISVAVDTKNGKRYYLVFDTRVRRSAPFGSKEVLERAQLEKYRLDHLLHLGSVPFEVVKRGNEPPDFIVSGAGGDWGVDCAALALEDRRRAESLFNRLVKRLAEHGQRAWDNLAGCIVHLEFISKTKLPPARDDVTLDTEIETDLASIVVDREGLIKFAERVAKEGFPKQWPNDVVIPNLKRARYRIVANFNPQWQPDDQFARSLGFKLILEYPKTIREISAEINRMVSQHDNPATQHLLLSIGGPGIDGFGYPSESMLGKILLDIPSPRVEAIYLNKVTAHVWDTGNLIEIQVERPN
jgi:hypothetical protein